MLREKLLRSKEVVEQEDLLSMSEAARELKITLEGVRKAIKSGYLQVIQAGPFRLVPRPAVEAYKKNRPKRGVKPGTKLGPRKKKV